MSTLPKNKRTKKLKWDKLKGDRFLSPGLSSSVVGYGIGTSYSKKGISRKKALKDAAITGAISQGITDMISSALEGSMLGVREVARNPNIRKKIAGSRRGKLAYTAALLAYPAAGLLTGAARGALTGGVVSQLSYRKPRSDKGKKRGKYNIEEKPVLEYKMTTLSEFRKC